MEEQEERRRQVCAELDRILVELMECLERLAALRGRLSREVGEGYFNMAKARYSMGPLSVGQLQYDCVMAPTCLVEVDEEAPARQDPDEEAPAHQDPDEEAPAHQDPDEEAPAHQDPDEEASAHQDPDEEASAHQDPDEEAPVRQGTDEPTPTDEIKSPPSHTVFRAIRPTSSGVGEGRVRGEEEGGVRRRRPQTGEAEPSGVEQVERRPREGEGRAPGVKSPLDWFGVLVPQALRHSQEHFIRATGVCCELATEQSRLESLRRHFVTLRNSQKPASRLSTS